MDEEKNTKSESEESGNKSTPKRVQTESDESLSLSLTPPIPEDDKSVNKSDDISEHLTSNSESIENDRSYQEIEISNRPHIFNLHVPDEEVLHFSQETPYLLNTSVCSDNSIISLNYLKNLELGDNVRSILDEILQNDQIQSDKDPTSNNSKEESLNIFANLDLDDKSLSNLRCSNEISVDEKNLYASNFGLFRNEGELEKRVKDFEELIAIKDSTIAVLTSELDSYREMSNTNTVSTLSTTEYKQLQEECHSKLLEYNNALVYKNDLIQQLTESLDQSVTERKALLVQIDSFKDEIIELQKQLQDTIKMVEMHQCRASKENTDKVDFLDPSKEAEENVEEECTDIAPSLIKEYSCLEKTLTPQQNHLLKELKTKFNESLEQSLTKSKEIEEQKTLELKLKFDDEKKYLEGEIARLRDLLANVKCGSTELMDLKDELEAKHANEMEELRTYFERKCSDLEKNYSEEIFSHQSRKLSGSTCSEAELNSDPIFGHPPGPDGDILYEPQPRLTKKDIFNLQNELNSLVGKICKYDLDNVADEDLLNLQKEIGKSNLHNLLKYDLSVIRNELQNKYHAELEILREDSENKLDEMNVRYESKLRDAEEKYLEEIESLKMRLEETGKQVSVCSGGSAVQEVGSSGEFEINEVIQSYERRLQEQVTLAKIDIITALETQIQRLAANEVDDEEWPSELLRLRDKFTHKYEADIEQLKREHQDEMDKVKEEHLKVLNGALERARRRSLRDTDSLSKGELEILRERDSLKKQVSSLRNLLGELLKYFTQCEDELNNTLVDELLKQGFDKNLSLIEDELNLTNSSPTGSSKTSDSMANVTRVHLTPNFKDLIHLIESSSQEDCDSKDISLDLKNELGFCLEKLKQDANAILALTTNMPKQEVADTPKNSSLEEKLTSLTRQLITESQAKEKLKEELEDAMRYTESLEREKDRLEDQLDQVIAKENILEADLAQAKTRIAQLIENGHKEIISEGYGEEGSEVQRWGDTLTILSDLQEKARSMLAQSRATADPTLLQLIEELCSVGERIKEESIKENRDLQQQIEAADKKYRTTHQFLEEQAAEREQERDEAQKRTEALLGQLRERDRDRANCEMAAVEVNCVCCRENRCTKLQVEQLEQQLQEMTKLLAGRTLSCKAAETERDEAVDKIKVLRDIVRELELQTEAKSKEIGEHLVAIERLQCMLEQRERSGADTNPGHSSHDVSDVAELCRHVEHLENELQRMRVQSELAGSEGALKQIRSQLYEFDILLDRKTKELESLHFTVGTNCSSPSEDISARDLVVPRSPKKMDESEVPLQQLARLKEKLTRHSRAEDAAIKRIKDLEMQVFTLRQEVEESGGERDYLKKQIQEQLVLISDFQIRLDEQRIRAEHIEKQTNTSLELKIYDLQAETTSLREKLQQKDKTVHQHQKLLEETRGRMRLLEDELGSAKDDEIVVEMQKEVEELRAENEQLKSKMSKDARMVPNLVENIISDKNVDIEKLRSRLDDTERLLEAYTSLNLDRRELQTISNMKNSGTSFEELLSIIELSQTDQMRRLERRNSDDTLGHSPNLMMQKRNVEETVLEPEMSAIKGPGFAHADFHARNSTEVSHKRVHFEDAQIESLRSEIAELKDELSQREAVIKEYEERLLLLNSLESKIEKLQVSLEETEKALSTATETFEREQTELRDREKDLGVELAEKKLKLSEAEKRVDMLEKDSQRREETYLNLSRAKKDLEKELNTLKHDSFVRLDTVIREKNDEIDALKEKLTANEEARTLKRLLSERNAELASLREENDRLSSKLRQAQSNGEGLQEKLKTAGEDNAKMRKELDNNEVQIESVTGEMNSLKEKLSKKRKAIRELEGAIEAQKLCVARLEQEANVQKVVLGDKEAEIDAANKNATRYQNDIALLEEEIKELKNGDLCQLTERVKEQDVQINDLKKERAHMMDLLNEKEKIVSQMAEDSHKLHVNLMTIKSKLKEPGNIIDLGNKLKEEQRRSAELVQEIHELKVRLMRHKNNDMVSSVDEITDQLKRELDYSAQIDSNIMTAVSDQSLNSVSELEDAEVYKKFLSFEKNSNKQLSSQIFDLQTEVEELRALLQKERDVLLQTQTDDSKLIEQLTIQLDVVLDREETLRGMLDEKKTELDRLEREVDSLKRKQVTSSESTEYKQLPPKEVLELSRLRGDFEKLQGENKALSEELEVLRCSKTEIDAAFKYTKELLGFEVQRVKISEEKIRRLLQSEKQLKESLKQKELDEENLKEELTKERTNFSKHNLELVGRLKAQPDRELQHNVLTNTVPDSLLEKIRELNNALLDNRKLLGIIQKLSNEKILVENELAIVKGGSKNNPPFSDLVARSDFLFAKTLKLESIKKALVWQKRYLMEHLQGHHQHCLNQALPNAFSNREEFKQRFTLRQRFRSAAFAIVSIIRMKYLVRRWHTGIRIAEAVNARHHRAPGEDRQEPIVSTRFQVGQPVSSQLFANVPGGNSNPFLRQDSGNSFGNVENPGGIPGSEMNVSWSGRTPPSKERKSRICIGTNILNREDLTPLKAPQLLAQFVERFDQIQEKLGVVLETNPAQGSC